jgi:putative tricarboxylic transport membrane protein
MGQLARVTRIRGMLLVPLILTLIYVGAFAEKNVFQDLGVVLVFGALGLAMARLGWPRPPLLLGLVLGPLAENRLFLSTDNYGAAWLLRPGVLLMLGLVVVGVLVSIVKGRARRPWPTVTGRAGAPSRLVVDGRTAFSLAAVVLLLWALWQSLSFGLRAGLFPWTVLAPTLIMAIGQLARDLRRRGEGRDRGPRGAVPDVSSGLARRRTAEIAAWIVGMYVAIWLLGFPVATLLTTFVYLKLGAREPWPVSVALSLGGFIFVYGLFERALGVPFPPGSLLAWVGSG